GHAVRLAHYQPTSANQRAQVVAALIRKGIIACAESVSAHEYGLNHILSCTAQRAEEELIMQTFWQSLAQRRWGGLFLFAALALLLVCVPTHAQVTASSSLEGTISDIKGAV